MTTITLQQRQSACRMHPIFCAWATLMRGLDSLQAPALVLGGFAVCVLALGVYPKPLTDLMEPSIAQLAMQLANSKL